MLKIWLSSSYKRWDTFIDYFVKEKICIGSLNITLLEVLWELANSETFRLIQKLKLCQENSNTWDLFPQGIHLMAKLFLFFCFCRCNLSKLYFPIWDSRAIWESRVVGLRVGRMAQWVGTCCGHITSGNAICTSSAHPAGWEAETGESLEVCKPLGLEYAAEQETLFHKTVEGEANSSDLHMQAHTVVLTFMNTGMSKSKHRHNFKCKSSSWNFWHH